VEPSIFFNVVQGLISVRDTEIPGVRLTLEKKMRKFLTAFLFACPLIVCAADTESTPTYNVQSSDFVVGKKAVNDKDWPAAVAALTRASKSDPRNADIHNYLGYSYRHMDQMDASFRHYNEALRLEPDHRGANEYIGWAYLKTNQLQKAEGQLSRLERICGKPCDEYQKLSKGIADYKAKTRS
jgi:Tfp pilus assembly protein PilF